jgi:hypothetical protein
VQKIVEKKVHIYLDRKWKKVHKIKNGVDVVVVAKWKFKLKLLQFFYPPRHLTLVNAKRTLFSIEMTMGQTKKSSTMELRVSFMYSIIDHFIYKSNE